MAEATLEEALAHPTWSMGAKVTIDSASLMNKALELVEAHHLFGLPAERLSVLVHRQSIVHGLVRLHDGSVLAQLAAPYMRTPIQQALIGDASCPGAGTPLDLASMATLDFEPVDESRFLAPSLARRVIEAGGTAGAILNAANEIAVEAFLERRLPFLAVVDTAAEVLASMQPRPIERLEDVLEAYREAREQARNLLSRARREAIG